MKALCRDLGVLDYKTCWDLQQSLFDGLIDRKTTSDKEVAGTLHTQAATPNNAGACGAEIPATSLSKIGASNADPDGRADQAGTFLLVEHPPVYTLGKSGHAENLLVDRAGLERLGAQFFHIDRGGDITFHGPGQLVCYPILDLERLGIGLREYIEALEEAVIRTVAHYGITAGRITGASGVWIDTNPAGFYTEGERDEPRQDGKCPKKERLKPVRPRKICAIGVRSSRYITMHGFALNVSTDLRWFSRINPCGFTDKGVTSMEAETGNDIPMEDVKTLVTKFLGEILNVRIYK